MSQSLVLLIATLCQGESATCKKLLARCMAAAKPETKPEDMEKTLLGCYIRITDDYETK